MSRKIRAASKVHVESCEHGHVHIILLDENDQTFAQAILGPEDACGFADDLDDVLDEIEDRSGTMVH